MKHFNPIYRIILTMATIVGTMACSDEARVDIIPYSSSEEFPIAASLQSKAAASGIDLDYSLYVFSKQQASTADAYQLEITVSPIEADSKLKFSNHDLTQKDYRFLFTATPRGTKEILVTTSTTAAPPDPGTSWENIRLISDAPLLSIDNYYEVKDLSGKDILTTDTVHGHLSRIVGQVVFDFFKVDPTTKDPVEIEAGFTSIFDRVDTVQVTYTNITSQLSFNAAGEPVPAATNPQAVTQKIQLKLDAHFGTPIPQTQADTLPGGVRAGGRLKGLYFFPATEILKTTLVFRYYDTTPTSTDPEHQTNPAYYDRRTLELSVPASGGLPVQANTYTVNKAGIYGNRIIDIGVSGGFDLNLNWDIK